MNPKKPKNFTFPVANNLGLPEELVEKVVEYYWKAVRTALTECKDSYIKLHGLGTFRAKPWKLPEVITKYENIINKYKRIIEEGQKISFQRFAIMKELEERLVELYKLKNMIKEEEDKKLKVKEKRNAKGTKKNLEDQGSDS